MRRAKRVRISVDTYRLRLPSGRLSGKGYKDNKTMTDQQYYREVKVVSGIGFALLVAAFAILLSSCTAIKKVFNKSKSDSTSVTKVKVDSTAFTDSTRLIKSSSESEGEIVFDFYAPYDDTATDVGIYVFPKRDYFTITPEGITTNMRPKKVTVKGKLTQVKIDSSHLKKEVEVSKQAESKVEVKKKEVSKDKEVKRFPVIPVTVAGLIVALCLFLFFYIRRKKRQIQKLIIPPL